MTFINKQHVFLDACALVRLVVDEPGARAVREYLETRPICFATRFSFDEALGVLKRKWVRGEGLSQERSLAASYRLITRYFKSERIPLDNLRLEERDVFFAAHEIVTKHAIDLLDALQILTIQDGRYRVSSDVPDAVLLTSDRKLAAEGEGLTSWLCQNDSHVIPPLGEV